MNAGNPEQLTFHTAHLFHIGSPSHIAALTFLALLGWAFIAWGRKAHPSKPTCPSRPSRPSVILAFSCLAGIIISYLVSYIDYPREPWAERLPLHFCDVMSVTCAFALLTRSDYIKTTSFFCVLSASIQALITPNLQHDFPSFTYYSFFFSHGVTVIAALYLFAALRWRPSRFGFLKAQGFGIAYLAVIHIVNLLLDTNFGFTRHIPQNGSVLSLLGPWPWYLFTMQIPAFIYMGILNIIVSRISNNNPGN